MRPEGAADDPACYHPIGITYDAPTGRIWVACYIGSIRVYDNRERAVEAVARLQPVRLIARFLLVMGVVALTGFGGIV